MTYFKYYKMKRKLLPGILFIITTGSIHAQNKSVSSADFARPDLVRRFEIHIPQTRLDSVMKRVRTATFPRQMPSRDGASDWETGMDIKWLKGLQSYWLNSYDWRKQEKLLNSYPQYIADVNGYEIQFYYIKGEGKNPLPLVLTHGWPGSTLEFFKVIDPLTQPSKYGGNRDDAFTLIIPALPGFGFSSMPAKPVNANTVAKLWNKLVTEIIGYKQYVAQGGDWGAGVTVRLGYFFPDNVKAIHLNFFPGITVPDSAQTEAERKYFASINSWRIGGYDYWRIQADKPMMAAVALHDSPLGTAGWIAEKFWAWSDNYGNLDSVISKDRLLTNIMLYIINPGGIDGSFWYYRGALSELNASTWPGYVNVPTSISKYPADMPVAHPPSETPRRGYNVVRFKEMPRGGHFAAMEQPELFAQDIREAFRPYRN
jgi:pimeloyl-ACP methyl ester carboxylesterase